MRSREDELYYSPSCTFKKLKDMVDNNRSEIIKAFKERVEELYLKPAELLIQRAKEEKENMGFLFSAGLICVSVIDFLGRFYTGQNCVRNRFIEWILKYMNRSFNSEISDKFYEDFRNGLVHECRIKNGGEFSLEIDKPIDVVQMEKYDYLVVNPEKLLEEIREAFENYITDLDKRNKLYEQLKKIINSDFESDFHKKR